MPGRKAIVVNIDNFSTTLEKVLTQSDMTLNHFMYQMAVFGEKDIVSMSTAIKAWMKGKSAPSMKSLGIMMEATDCVLVIMPKENLPKTEK